MIEIEAQNNLASLSQQTNYITNWNEMKLKRHRQKIEITPQQYQSHPKHQLPKRQKQMIKEVSEKYNLKKCQYKLQTINQTQFIAPHPNLFKLEDSYKLPSHLYKEIKVSQLDDPKRKIFAGIHSQRCLQGQFLKRKLLQYERKKVQSQKNLHSRLVRSKPSSLPRLVQEQRNQKFEFKKARALVSEQEIQKIKRAITKQSKRYSLPLLESGAQVLPLIKGLH